jgi:ribosomal protein S18 acetylase RimI-like enzyme
MKILSCNERLDELVSFVTRLNHDSAHHIGYFGVGEADVRVSLSECIIPPAQGFRLAYDHEKLIGILGVDADPQIGRAWLYGPIIEYADWQMIADELLAAILPFIPAEIKKYEIFCDAQNTNIQRFAARHNFNPRSENVIFYLLRSQYKPGTKSPTEIIDYQRIYLEQFERIHIVLFPNAYFTTAQIVSKLDENHRLLIAIENDRLLGYTFCKIEPESESGYVDFIGTDLSARGRGLGADLLAAGLDWMLAAPTTQKINLTVNTDNTAACSLYNKFGFKTERVLRGYRKVIS